MAVGKGDYQYDVALSFAGEDRTVVEQLAVLLREEGLDVFYDNFKISDLWGRDLFQHLDDVYANQARFCVVFVSEAYAKKAWTNHELKSAQSRAFLEKNEAYILPVRLDDTVSPGIRPTMGYLDLRKVSIRDVAHATLEKIAKANTTAPKATGSRGRKADKPAAKTATKAPANKAPAAKRAVVIDGSGDWVLLADTFFKAQSIDIPDEKRFVVAITTADAEEEAKLKSIRTSQHQLGRQIPFAFGNDAFAVRCESAPSTFEGGAHKWRVTLLKEETQYGGGLMEMAYSDGSNHYTPEQFAKMRAERILLGAHPAAPSRRGNFDVSGAMLESFIQGNSNHIKVTNSPIRELAKKMPRTDAAQYLTFARLLAMYYLKAGGVVEHIERLALGPLKGDSVHVKFRGRRYKKYSNVDPEVIEVEGDCPLS